MTDKVYNIQFPKKLEYGEVVSEAYSIRAGSKEMYEKALAKDPEATLQVTVGTTIGEIYKSNEYKLSELLSKFQYAK